MGEKGSKATTEGDRYATLLVRNLAPIGEVTSKKMFGGHGLFHKGVMFGLIDPKGAAYLKADKKMAAAMETMGSYKHGRMPYYSIPLVALNSTKELLKLARNAIALAEGS
jgi:DNA transformation protein